MRWILRTLLLLIVGVLIAAVFAPGIVGTLRQQILGATEKEPSMAEFQRKDTEERPDDLAFATATAANDRSPGIQMSPMFDGLIRLGNQIAEVSNQELAVDVSLENAAKKFNQNKSVNQKALQDLSRPYRRLSPGTPHLLLITVSGLTNEDVLERHIQSSDSTLSRMYRDGIRFIQYYSPRSRDRAWHELQTGNLMNGTADASAGLVRNIRKSGYLTALVGDCTQAINHLEPSAEHYDYHFGVTQSDDRDRSDVTSFQSDGRPLEVVIEGEDIETQDIYLNQAASYFAANRRGRPIFVHLTLDVSSGENHNLQIVRLDRRLKLLMNFVESQSMERELVIMLAALGTTPSTGGPVSGPVAEQAPLLMYRPDRKVGKSVEFLCSTCDILPTVAEWTRASAIEGRDGISLKSKTDDEDDQGDRSLVWEKNYPNQKTVIAQSPWQLILSDPPQLYDTIRDPEKSENLRQKLPLIRENLSDLTGAE